MQPEQLLFASPVLQHLLIHPFYTRTERGEFDYLWADIWHGVRSSYRWTEENPF